jgi:hypothetical protein
MESTVAVWKKGSEAFLNLETQNGIRPTAIAFSSTSKRDTVVKLYKIDTEVHLIFPL